MCLMCVLGSFIIHCCSVSFLGHRGSSFGCYEDFVTDLRLMSPVYHTFSPEFSGFVHGGMLCAAQFVVENVHKALQSPDCPEGLPILVTGESC